MSILAIILAVAGVIGFFAFTTYSNIFIGAAVLLSMITVACAIYALGQIMDDVRDMRNVLVSVFPDKLEDEDDDKTE